MLEINRQIDYAVCVLFALAKRGEGARLSDANMPWEMLIPGPDGGSTLHCPATPITLRNVTEAFREMASITFEGLVKEFLGVSIAIPSFV